MNSMLSYMGGKSLLTSKIIPLIPKHECYVEVFCGAAWLLFRKAPSKVEIINDINSELTALYRVVKNHPAEFQREFSFMLIARDEFDRFLAANPETLTEIQRAVRFFMILKTCYGSRIDNPTLSVSTIKASNLNLEMLPVRIMETHERLQRVTIENLPYQQILKRYDKPHVFMYLDPPYHECEDYYGDGIFEEQDFITLRDWMKTAKSKFIMSINDTGFIRETYQDLVIKEVETIYSVMGGNKKQVTELLIANFNMGQ